MFKRVVVGISGGVDSAVTALLLKHKGFNVTGVFMRNWDIRDETGVCKTDQDYEDAQWVCNKLKIPLVEVNFVKQYWNNVFTYVIEKYENGCTPNPDILCNKYIKFKEFFHFARTELQADAIATGHYVKTSFGPYLEHFKPDTNVKLFKGDDVIKDQTFYLSQVPQDALRYSMFPLGGYQKKDVKSIAQEAGLDLVVSKKESMGICFIGKRNFHNFISEYLPDKAGHLIDLDSGKIIGDHTGIHKWTVGQRVNTISGLPNAYFIYKKDLKTNDIYVVSTTNHPALYTDTLKTNHCHWIAEEPPEFSRFSSMLDCDFCFQHTDLTVPCTVLKTAENNLIIQLGRPLRAITDGQFAVLYNGEECLGSAEILFRGPSYYSMNEEVKTEHLHKNIAEEFRKLQVRDI